MSLCSSAPPPSILGFVLLTDDRGWPRPPSLDALAALRLLEHGTDWVERSEIQAARWGPGPDRDEASYRLDRVVSEGDHFAYEYDFGDGWEHVIKGKGACPPEDSGGVWGYYATLAALKVPASPEHEEALEWLGEDFDPALFDLLEADAAVASLFSRSARRRRAGVEEA